MEVNKQAVCVVVQARTDSNRLPAKALLPVGGISSAVLAARRAANRCHSVILATSDRPTDDLLALTAERAGLKVFRGSAFDVLGRFVAATRHLGDGDIVVRLTADNMLPDGALVEELLVAYMTAEKPYLNAEHVWGACPYGLSAEVMRAGALRCADHQADNAFDREHVTPLIKKTVSIVPSQNRFSSKEQVVRCTLDTFDDYLRISRIFSNLKDPVHIGWRELLDQLVNQSDAPRPIAIGPRLVLGTAQLAAPYGSAVKVTPPQTMEAVELVRGAIHRGAIAVDTARAYTGSEALLGVALSQGWGSRIQIVTKLSPLTELSADAEPRLAADAAEISVLRSLHALGGIKPSLLLHRSDHLNAWDGAVWVRLQELKAARLVASLGVSVQSPNELKTALRIPNVQIIQMPYNLLDWRWHEGGVEELLVGRSDVEVHIRSIFLQGLLLRNSAEWPPIPNLDAMAVASELQALVEELRRENITDLCLAYVRSARWVNGVVIGMERRAQLVQNLALFENPPLTLEEVERVRSSLPRVPEILLNPALWPILSENI